MGAGYTRWFRPGGNIWMKPVVHFNPQTNDWIECISCDYEIVAKPIWPSKKSFFGLFDPKPELGFISARVVGPFNHTVHKFGKPNVTYIDEATNFTNEQWEIQWEILRKRKSFYRKEWITVPNPSKRQKFLDAGGSFDKPEQYFTDKDNIAITSCYKGPLCKIRPVYNHYNQGNTIHFHNSVKQQPKEAWFVKDRTHNFENILQNTDENIWHASKGRKFYIKANYGGVMLLNGAMADKHLVSTMRYLVAAWKEIQETVGKYSPSSFAFVKKYFKLAREAKNAPSFYEIILPCWPTLVSEFVERFGSEALTSILDGN